MEIGNFTLDVGWTLGITAFSVFVILGSIFMALRVVARIPVDYFQSSSEPTGGNASSNRGLMRRILENAAGIVLVFAGIAMLVLPGQGILTILAGLLLIDFPGKYKLERKLASIQPVLKVINAIRSKADKDPLCFSPE